MIKEWRLKEWTGISEIDRPMSNKEIKEAIEYLRKNRYPVPKDCIGEHCPGKRPTCSLGVCHVAVKLCGDF